MKLLHDSDNPFKHSDGVLYDRLSCLCVDELIESSKHPGFRLAQLMHCGSRISSGSRLSSASQEPALSVYSDLLLDTIKVGSTGAFER